MSTEEAEKQRLVGVYKFGIRIGSVKNFMNKENTDSYCRVDEVSGVGCQVSVGKSSK